jgi:amino acid transporter
MTDVRLARAITGPQYFTLAFGSIVGAVWVVILGQLVQAAGPGGTALALLLGGLMIVLVGFCYGEVAAALPAAGGELVYAHETFGAFAAFAVGWILALVYVSICVFETISLGLVTDMLFPGAAGPTLYRMFGQEVHAGGLAIGLSAALVLAVINSLGAHLTARAQEVVTYARVALMAVFLVTAFVFSDPKNLQPLFADGAGGKGFWVSFLGVLITAPVWYAGFSVFATATEERSDRSSARSVGRAVIFGILAAIAFYCLLVLGVSGLVPWRSMAAMDLPAAKAFEIATGDPWMTRIVLLTALLGTLTAWNAVLIAGSRVLFALGRARLLPVAFGRLHQSFRTPVAALLFITCICVLGAFLGRGFILPIVNITSLAFALTYVVTCAAALRLRRSDPDRPLAYKVPGDVPVIWIALAGSLLVAMIALVQPYLAAGGRAPVEWAVLGGWCALGVAAWVVTAAARRAMSPSLRRALLRGE